MDQQFGQPNQGEQQGFQQQPPQYQYQYNNTDLSKPMSVGQYMLTMLIMAIPIVGIVMMFVWAFGSNTNINKKNWMRANLLWVLIILALYIVIAIIFGAAFFAMFNGMNNLNY